jgi:transcriptional regulator with XRE-family HTH domain
MTSNEEPITPRKAFGKLLKRYRMRAGLTQAELGTRFWMRLRSQSESSLV